jgi:hypothetical protein
MSGLPEYEAGVESPADYDWMNAAQAAHGLLGWYGPVEAVPATLTSGSGRRVWPA